MRQSRKKVASSNAANEAIERHERRANRFKFLRERLAAVDVEAVWTALEDGLTLGKNRKDPEYIIRSLDETDSMARKAGMILQCAREELQEFDLHFVSAYHEWESRARTALEAAKKEKRFSGSITKDQVEGWVAKNVADYTRWKNARRALERNEALAKQMKDAWDSRAASLRKMADVAMKRMGVDPSMLDRRNNRRKRGEEDADK